MFDRAEAARRLVLNLARWSGAARLTAAIDGGVGAILMLHRVTDAPPKRLRFNDGLAVTPAFLDAVLQDMKRAGCRLVSMDEAVDRLKSGSKERFAAITLDDGYRDNLVEALPVFEKNEAPFTIYIAPALTDGAIEPWWEILEDAVEAQHRLELDGALVLDCSTAEKKKAAAIRLQDYLTRDVAEEDQPRVVRELAQAAGAAIRRSPLMDWSEIRRIAAHPLGAIGAHTVHHVNLARLPTESALLEMEESAAILEERLGERPRHFAYPYGSPGAATAREVALAGQAGYVSAVTTRHGVLRDEHARHLHALPRISLNGRYQQVGHVRTMLSGVTTPLANRGRRLVTV